MSERTGQLFPDFFSVSPFIFPFFSHLSIGRKTEQINDRLLSFPLQSGETEEPFGERDKNSRGCGVGAEWEIARKMIDRAKSHLGNFQRFGSPKWGLEEENATSVVAILFLPTYAF